MPKRFPWIDGAEKFINDYQGANLIDEPEADAEKESAAAVERALARAQGQGFARTPKQRGAIERHAMACARKYFRNQGYDVEDVSKRRPYDLLCRRGRTELHVEVKGMTTNGNAIVLTNNEVKHARDKDNSCALFVLHSIRLKKKQKAIGGKQKLCKPWQPQRANLTPISFTYRFD